MSNSIKSTADSNGKDDKYEDTADDSQQAQTSSSRKKRVYIDESLLPDDEAKQLEARRAYNRSCAAKARQRSKDTTAQLQEQVAKLKEENAELEHRIEVARARMQFLERQNQFLVSSQQSQSFMAPAPLLNSQQYVLGNSSLGGMRNIDQVLLSLSSSPYMQSAQRFPGTANANLVLHPGSALANLQSTSNDSTADSSFFNHLRGQLPPM